ncbi:MAG: TonB-dependent receptor [Balneolaceae bacterium]|jgi:outer membrane receptor protein involved in Fe transport|nr:TonB-dependent receptor [Balneolaceae bacterium]MCR9133974.1 TonB-dependent receptor [bacterium]
MKKILSNSFGLALVLSLIFHSASLAEFGTKGKIAGTVIDESGETLIGVQVYIDGTTKGTLTDVDGKYTIINLDPGTYTVVFSYIGFATTRVEKVQVIVDKTTEVNVTLREEVIEGQEIVVTAERPIVEKDRTTTTSYISSEQLEALPLVSINEAINQTAGVVDGHFRGGRTGEVSYLVNGVPINNAFNNGASFDVEQNMVSSLEVISGVFNAEYGQALSGVVNIVTKGVSPEWSGNFLGYVGRIVSGRELEFVTRNTDQKLFLSADDFSNEKFTYSEVAPTIGDQDYQVSLGGPIIKDKLSIQTTLRYVKFDGHLIGRDLFRPSDVQSANVRTGDNPSSWLIQASGDGDFESINRQERLSLNSSFVYEINSRLKFDYNLFYQFGDGRNYDQAYKYNPSGINNYYFSNQTHIAGLRLSMGDNAFANFSYSFLNDQAESYLYDDVTATGDLDERYVPAAFSSQQGADAFVMGGNYLGSGQEITKTHTIVADYTNQINNVVLWKSGVSTRFHRLDNENFGISVNLATGRAFRSTNDVLNNSLEVNPWEAAAYSQVKLEFDELIVNAGLRFDYFEPDFVVPRDYTQFHLETIPDPNNPGQEISNRIQADPTYQLSPRLGVAFPISQTGVMRFSAGLFFQTPQLNLLYVNNEFDRSQSASAYTLGNANLEPERTLQFEIGLQQGLTETMGLDLTVFSKDVRELAGQTVVRGNTGVPVGRLENIDYGTVKGVTFSLYERGTGQLSWTLDYTLQFASGSASDPGERFNRFVNNAEDIIFINRLNWDRRNVLNNSITWVSKFGLTLSAINSLQSGSPYTSERDDITSLIPNNLDTPTWFNSDVRAYYKPPAISHNVEFFVQVDNLFDSNPHFGIYNDTGLANESTDLWRLQNSVGRPGGLNTYEEFYLDPSRRGAPRSVKIGLSYNF